MINMSKSHDEILKLYSEYKQLDISLRHITGCDLKGLVEIASQYPLYVGGDLNIPLSTIAELANAGMPVHLIENLCNDKESVKEFEKILKERGTK